MYADLHIHSTASDGIHAPDKIVDFALKKGLSVISLTDHDSTDGIDQA
ncbi:MAG TPA: phosphatase, partial [Syntrophaceticus sp.]|nr:phosphatase [Syntrophaceticus sp.]